MNKKSLLAIERIIVLVNELIILTKNKTADYFYDSPQITVLLDIVNEIDNNIDKINLKIKNKYKNIAWDIIKKENFVDEIFGESIKLGIVYDLSNKILKEELLGDLYNLLENELPDYYKNYIKNLGSFGYE